jgi:alpha-D-xyloside xylohydrolase
MFSEAASRKVYLPPGQWIDFQSGKTFAGAQWHDIAAGEIPVVLLVRDGATIPMAKVAQSTADIDWKNIESRKFSAGK